MVTTPRELRGTRYLTGTERNKTLAHFIQTELPYLDYEETLEFYAAVEEEEGKAEKALLGCNDRYYLLTSILGRADMLEPWVFERCREVEADPDGYLDLWARYHFKSSIITQGGIIQEVLCNPELCVCIFSHTKPIAVGFLEQIKREFETKTTLKWLYDDVLYQDPVNESPKWSKDEGIIIKRQTNPREATVEAWGLVDGQPISRHYGLLVFDDVVTDKSVTNDEQIKKTTAHWELADNLVKIEGSPKWHAGTRYSWGDTYGVIIERGSLKVRLYPATHDGTLKGKPVLLTEERWEQIKRDQKSTVNAQMLLNPVVGAAATFQSIYFQHYDIIPGVLNVYIMVDPSKGQNQRSDRTAIAVVGVDQAGNKYLLDGYCHRMRLSERYELIKQLKAKWEAHPGVQLVAVGYERYGMQVDLEVIEEHQRRENVYFDIAELNTPQKGKHSKNDRIERLDPDIRFGRFYLPCVVRHPQFGGHDHGAYWDVWTEEKSQAAQEAGKKDYPIGDIIYRPMLGLTRAQRWCEATAQRHRIVKPLARLDENGDVYDVTRVHLEEARLHPFAPHDDWLDALSRIYDMEPIPARQFEHQDAEPLAYQDS